MSFELVALGRALAAARYHFITVTPATHRLVNARPQNREARSLGDVFGWNRPFNPQIVPPGLFELARSAGACEPIAGSELWRATVRFSSLNGRLYAHSAFPTNARDAVFFGPDTYRFARAIERHAPHARRAVDVGCGGGPGGIVLALSGKTEAPVVLADITEEALRFARINAALAGVEVEVVQSDVLDGVPGDVDLIVSNPPYIQDGAARAYRDGGGSYGEGIGARIVRESVARLRQNGRGGSLLLYTGSAIVQGADTFHAAISGDLAVPGVSHSYEELDPDVFGDELQREAYAEVERIAIVLLLVRVHSGG